MSRADFLLTPEELLHRRRKRLRLVVVLVLLVVFAVGAYFGTRPALNAIKGWQARRHATKAFAFIEEQKWNEARDAAVAGYQLRPSEPQAVRAVARFLSRTKQQQALEFWDRLEKTERLTRDDRRDEAAVALAMGEGTRAAEAIAHLLDPAMGEPGPADWLLAAQAAVQGGQAEEAVPYLEKILAAPSANKREQLQAALLRLALPAPEGDPAQAARTAALARVVELSRSDSAVGLDALLILAQHAASLTTAREQAPADAGQPNDSAAEATAESSPAPAALPGTDAIPSLPDLATAIERHPLAQPPHQLLALDLKAHQQVGGREASIEQAIARWEDAEAPAVAALATWLNGKGEHERLLAVVPLERALQTHDLFLQYVDALGALGRWSEIKALLDTERFALDPVIQRMYLARINAQLGEKTASENNWQRALE
ncbi:MAG: hypothetical protein H0V56_13085, partial [Chthoniobacterales bacterium]|nr:hypothetical protein [Chthoniobacterales bacterium]